MHQLPDQRCDEGACIDVVGVDFIQNDDLARKGESADEEVFYGHHGLKSLIYGPHAIRGDQGLLGGGEPGSGLPGISMGGVILLISCRCVGRLEPEVIIVLQPGVGVGQAQGCRVLERGSQESGNAFVNAIAGDLGGEGEVKPPVLP